MQAITVRYHGPSNVRGSRLKATAAAGSVTIGYPSELNSAEGKALAARKLCEKMQWAGLWFAGGAHDESTVFVCVDPKAPLQFTDWASVKQVAVEHWVSGN